MLTYADKFAVGNDLNNNLNSIPGIEVDYKPNNYCIEYTQQEGVIVSINSVYFYKQKIK